MTETARVESIDGQVVTVVPLDLDVCLGCSNEHCRSEGSRFTAVNRRRLPLEVGSRVKIGAPAGRQALQAVVAFGLPVLAGGVVYAALAWLLPAFDVALRALVSVGAAVITAALLAKAVRPAHGSFPEITALMYE